LENLLILRAKPNKSFTLVFVQPLITTALSRQPKNVVYRARAEDRRQKAILNIKLIDMVNFDHSGAIVSPDGATLNAPERAVIDSPIGGEWYYVLVYGSELYRPDSFKLFLTAE
jgi:hypothetical protein